MNKLSLTVQYASSAQNQPSRAQFRRWVKVALQQDVSMTLRIVDEEEGKALNRQFRNKDYATNVLTFAYDDDPYPAEVSPDNAGECLARTMVFGDVVICAPVVEREASEQQKELLAHYAHMTLHAALHLQGYEHENDVEAEEMEALETSLMLKLRYPDPYQTTAISHG